MPGPLIPGAGPFSAADFLRWLGKTSPRYMGRDLGREADYSRPRVLPMNEPFSYEDLLRDVGSLPIRLEGDPRDPTVGATVPLPEGLRLLLQGGRNRGMATLAGRF